MGDKKHRTAVAWGQNLTILALSISALWLLGQAQLYPMKEENSILGGIFAQFRPQEPVVDRPAEGWGQGSTLRPAKMALLGEMGCYAVQYDDGAVANLFGQVMNPLVDVLAGADAPRRATRQEWEEALSGGQTGVYLDFLGSVPLAGLHSWSSGGRPNQTLSHSARRMVITVTAQGGARLYYINEDDGLFYVCDTTAQVTDRLAQLMEGVSPNGQFAFQEEQMGALEPYTLLGFLAPQPQVYTSWIPISLMGERREGMLSLEELAERVEFHPQSYTTYAVTDGQTIREGGDTLSVTQDGEVTFRAAEDETARYPIASDKTAHDHWEAVDGAWAFADQVLSPLCGEARLYLMDWQADEGDVTAYFGYLLDGAMVHLSGSDYAAKVVVQDGKIDSFVLHLRRYESTQETTLVLQEARAVAAMTALDAEGSELLLAYLDRGTEQVTAGWIAQS